MPNIQYLKGPYHIEFLIYEQAQNLCIGAQKIKQSQDFSSIVWKQAWAD